MAAFADWLRHDGWTVDTEVDFVDVSASRGGERLYAEAKGCTVAMGLDVDTMYGQLLRRMKDPASGARYAVVVTHGWPPGGSSCARLGPRASRARYI